MSELAEHIDRWLERLPHEAVRVRRTTDHAAVGFVWEIIPASWADRDAGIVVRERSGVATVELGTATVVEFHAEKSRGVLGPDDLEAVLNAITHVGFQESVWMRDGEILRSRARITGHGVDISPTRQSSSSKSRSGGEQVDCWYAPLTAC